MVKLIYFLNKRKNNNFSLIYSKQFNCQYDYDLYGNITSIERTLKTGVYSNLPSIQTFIYNSYNELISYTVDGVTYQVSYNNGNPNKYKDYNLSFTNGNLTSLTNTFNNISYEYNADGIRIKKVVGDVTTSYTVFEGRIIEETVEYENADTNGYTIKYLYDDNNLLLGFIYNEETYYYQRTLTGEIVKIINSEGQVVGEYIYDAYGNILNINSLTAIAEVNPYRYKGYYFDLETSLYYCKSRYYSPEIIRWISQDEIEYLDTSSVNGCNLYTYCNNNPITGYDPNGNWTLSFSINLNLNVFFGFSLSLSFSIDSNGENAIQLSYSGFTEDTPNIGVLDAGVSVSGQYTDLSSVDYLEGTSTYIGGSIGNKGYISADLITDSPVSEQDGEIIGGQLGVGVGYGFDVHCMTTKTITIKKNHKGIINRFFEWIF